MIVLALLQTNHFTRISTTNPTRMSQQLLRLLSSIRNPNGSTQRIWCKDRSRPGAIGHNLTKERRLDSTNRLRQFEGFRHSRSQDCHPVLFPTNVQQVHIQLISVKIYTHFNLRKQHMLVFCAYVLQHNILVYTVTFKWS